MLDNSKNNEGIEQPCLLGYLGKRARVLLVPFSLRRASVIHVLASAEKYYCVYFFEIRVLILRKFHH